MTFLFVYDYFTWRESVGPVCLVACSSAGLWWWQSSSVALGDDSGPWARSTPVIIIYFKVKTSSIIYECEGYHSVTGKEIRLQRLCRLSTKIMICEKNHTFCSATNLIIIIITEIISAVHEFNCLVSI